MKNKESYNYLNERNSLVIKQARQMIKNKLEVDKMSEIMFQFDPDIIRNIPIDEICPDHVKLVKNSDIEGVLICRDPDNMVTISNNLGFDIRFSIDALDNLSPYFETNPYKIHLTIHHCDEYVGYTGHYRSFYVYARFDSKTNIVTVYFPESLDHSRYSLDNGDIGPILYNFNVHELYQHGTCDDDPYRVDDDFTSSITPIDFDDSEICFDVTDFWNKYTESYDICLIRRIPESRKHMEYVIGSEDADAIFQLGAFKHDGYYSFYIQKFEGESSIETLMPAIYDIKNNVLSIRRD